MYIKFNPKLIQADKLYGTTTVGTRGQVVIPAMARKELKIKPGDQLLVLSKHGKALGLIKSEDLGGLIEMLMENIIDKKWKAKIMRYVKKVFGDKASLTNLGKEKDK